jgi:hypothetical protein
LIQSTSEKRFEDLFHRDTCEGPTHTLETVILFWVLSVALTGEPMDGRLVPNEAIRRQIKECVSDYSNTPTAVLALA